MKQKNRRIICALTAAMLSVSLLAAPARAGEIAPPSADGETSLQVSAGETSPRFTDIIGHPAQEIIELYAEKGIVNGVGADTFEPDRALKRSEMCAILDRVFSYEAMSPNTFPDLLEDKWYYECVLRLNAAGVILGDETGVRPEDTLRWNEALLMYCRAFHVEPRSDVVSPWPAQSWVQDYVAALYARGCLPDGVPDLNSPFTRADAVILLDRLLMGYSPGVDNPGTVTGPDTGPETNPDIDPGTDPGTVTDPGSIPSTGTGTIIFRDHVLPILSNVPVNQYNKNAFFWWNGRMYYNDGETPVAYGVDVSAYQKDIDWYAVAADGIDYAILRIGGRGYGAAGNLYWDTYFEQNLAGAQAAGLDVGIYFFSQAITPWEAAEEAQLVLARLGGRALTYPIVYDWESISGVGARTDGLDTATLTACAQAFCNTIASAGYQPMVYFNATDGLLRYDLSQLVDYPFWYAYYLPQTSTDPWLYYNFRMWQYTSSGSVAGIPGRADMNICFYPYGKVHQQ